MERRTFARGCGTVGLAGLWPLTGCTDPLSIADESGRHLSSDWQPGPGEWARGSAYGPGGNRHNPNATPPRSEPDIAWRTNDPGGRTASFAIADGTWFVREASTLSALDTDDGVEYQLLVEPDPDGDGRTVHLRASDGDTVWERSFGTPASRHAVADGTVYLEAGGDLVALDAATGETRWRLPEMGGELALVGNTIYVNGEKLYALRD